MKMTLSKMIAWVPVRILTMTKRTMIRRDRLAGGHKAKALVGEGSAEGEVEVVEEVEGEEGRVVVGGVVIVVEL